MRGRFDIVLVVVAGLLVSQPVAAGEISGTIVAQGRPLPGVKVVLNCGNKAVGNTTTDNFGRYWISAAGASGRCALDVEGATPMEVYLFAAPARYDFERVGNSLRRR
jgi:hypothetical protein